MPLPRHLIRVITALLLVLGVANGAPTAAAHTALTATDPVADSTVSSGPTRVTATFNEELQPTFAAMTVVGPEGHLWSAGEPEVHEKTVSVPVRPLGPAGKYTVNYRVTSADGHVVTGSWSFTVTEQGSGQPGPAVQTSEHRDRIALWPFAVGAVVVVAAALLWRMRRGRS